MALGGKQIPEKCDANSKCIVRVLWGVYSAWIELDLASQCQQSAGRRWHEQEAQGVTLTWWRPAGGSERPIVSLKV